MSAQIIRALRARAEQLDEEAAKDTEMAGQQSELGYGAQASASRMSAGLKMHIAQEFRAVADLAESNTVLDGSK